MLDFLFKLIDWATKDLFAQDKIYGQFGINDWLKLFPKYVGGCEVMFWLAILGPIAVLVFKMAHYYSLKKQNERIEKLENSLKKTRKAYYSLLADYEELDVVCDDQEAYINQLLEKEARQ